MFQREYLKLVLCACGCLDFAAPLSPNRWGLSTPLVLTISVADLHFRVALFEEFSLAKMIVVFLSVVSYPRGGLGWRSAAQIFVYWI